MKPEEAVNALYSALAVAVVALARQLTEEQIRSIHAEFVEAAAHSAEADETAIGKALRDLAWGLRTALPHAFEH